jgi:hypothetical protein
MHRTENKIEKELENKCIKPNRDQIQKQQSRAQTEDSHVLKYPSTANAICGTKIEPRK